MNEEKKIRELARQLEENRNKIEELEIRLDGEEERADIAIDSLKELREENKKLENKVQELETHLGELKESSVKYLISLVKDEL